MRSIIDIRLSHGGVRSSSWGNQASSQSLTIILDFFPACKNRLSSVFLSERFHIIYPTPLHPTNGLLFCSIFSCTFFTSATLVWFFIAQDKYYNALLVLTVILCSFFLSNLKGRGCGLMPWNFIESLLKLQNSSKRVKAFKM